MFLKIQVFVNSMACGEYIGEVMVLPNNTSQVADQENEKRAIKEHCIPFVSPKRVCSWF